MACRRTSSRRLTFATLFAVLGGFALGAGATVPHSASLGAATVSARQAAPAVKPAKREAIARLAEPWPDEQEIASRRIAAEQLPLFESDAPLAITLKADFSKINRDRTRDSTKRFPGVLEVQAQGGQLASIPVQLSTRGNARLNVRTCSVAPLRVEFAAKDRPALDGTPFRGQRELKLVTHCSNSGTGEQNVLVEYLTYRIFRLFTPRSYRARLTQVSYWETGKDKAPEPRYGMFLERDADVARRMEGRLYPLEKRLFSMIEQESLILTALLQYMVGNTDYSIYALHNVRLVQDRSGKVYPVSYDFDYSGLVDASYAVADKKLEIASVRERLYRGPCRSIDQLEPYLATLRSRKAELLALPDTIPALKEGRRKDVRDYLEDFFEVVENPARAKRELVDKCRAAAGM